MKISVITVAFNAAATIGDTIQSVLAQDWDDYEHLIVDGLSRDSTVSVAQSYWHERMKLISEPDEGCYDAMNKGLAIAGGDVVVFLNADDILARSDALRLVAKTFLGGSADCVGGQTAVVDQHDLRTIRRLYRSQGFQPWMLRFGHMPPHPSFYARRDVLIEAGGFDTRYRIASDFDLMTRLFRPEMRFVTLPHTLAAFRQGGLSTRDLNARMRINDEIREVLRSRGISASLPQLWCRYPLKAMQILRRPTDYPHMLDKLGLACSAL